MDWEAVGKICVAIESVVTSVGILVGGSWVLWRFRLGREDQSRPEVSVGIDFVGRHAEHWVVEAWVLISNKGPVRQVMSQIELDLRVLRAGDDLRDGDARVGHQLLIPHKVKSVRLVPEGWRSTHVDPGVCTRYSHVASLPHDAVLALIHAKLFHKRDGDWHTADRLVRVPCA